MDFIKWKLKAFVRERNIFVGLHGWMPSMGEDGCGYIWIRGRLEMVPYATKVGLHLD